MSKNLKRIVFTVLSFLVLTGVYEFVVFLWKQKQHTPVIRVDIYLIYPIIFVISLVVYYLLGKKK